MTRGGLALRSMTDTRLSGVCLVGSLGSTLADAVTRARLSSGVIATLSGGPTTLTGAFTSATTRGGLALRSMIATVSDGALGTTFTVPLTLTTLLSLADTASSAPAWAATASRASIRTNDTTDFMGATSRIGVERRLGEQVRTANARAACYRPLDAHARFL